MAPSGEASALAKMLTSRLCDSRVERAQAHALERLHHRREVDRIPHHRMADSERARREARIADQNDDIVHELDSGRARRHGRIQPPIFQHLASADIGADLAQRFGDADGRSAARIAHRSIAARGDRRLAARAGLLDALAGQQGAFDLDEMHIAHVVDAGVAHRSLDSSYSLVDLRVPTDLLRQEVASLRNADAEALLARALAGALGPRASREHCDMRRQHALRAARHDERDSGLDLARSELHMRRKRVAQRGDGVFASKVVHPAVAFGLAQHRENGRRLERAAVDESHQAGNVSRPAGWNANHVE